MSNNSANVRGWSQQCSPDECVCGHLRPLRVMYRMTTSPCTMIIVNMLPLGLVSQLVVNTVIMQTFTICSESPAASDSCWTLSPLCPRSLIRLEYHGNWFTRPLRNTARVQYSLCPLCQTRTSAQTQACTHACSEQQETSQSRGCKGKHILSVQPSGEESGLTLSRCLSCFSWK